MLEVPLLTDVLEIDLTKIEPCVAGPKRPQDEVLLRNLKTEFIVSLLPTAEHPAGQKCMFFCTGFRKQMAVCSGVPDCSNGF